MIEGIRSFIDQLRRPTPWPQGLVLDSDLLRELHETWKKNELLATLHLDRFEAALLEIYDAGGDDPAGIDVLDQVVAIIRQTTIPAEQRFRQIGDLMYRLQPKARPM